MRACLPCLLLLCGCLGSAGELPPPASPDAGTTSADAGTQADAGTGAPRPVWVTGYYAGWMHPTLPVSEVDFGALTHVAHFAWMPQADGTLDTGSLGLTEERSRAVVAAAHAAGCKALLVVGGAWSREGFRAALAPGKVDGFVAALVSGVTSLGYDGVDLDMEPVLDEDAPLFVPFVQALRTALDGARPGLLLTAAVDWNAASYGPVLPLFDQLNLMTYDLSGAWPGWESWHNTPLHNGGLVFQSTGKPLPSLETQVSRALAGGAPREKLGVGISFYAYVWNGVDGPNQGLQGVTVDMNKPWAWMMDTLYSPAAYRWHAGAEAPYLSLGTGSGAKFVSFDDARSVAAKLAWVRAQGLGGVILWELGGGYRASQPPGERDALLQSVKAAARGP